MWRWQEEDYSCDYQVQGVFVKRWSLVRAVVLVRVRQSMYLFFFFGMALGLPFGRKISAYGLFMGMNMGILGLGAHCYD